MSKSKTSLYRVHMWHLPTDRYAVEIVSARTSREAVLSALDELRSEGNVKPGLLVTAARLRGVK